MLEYEHFNHTFLWKCTITTACGTSLKLGYKPEDFIMKKEPLIWNSELKEHILYTHTTFLAILTLTRFIPEKFEPYTPLVLPHLPRCQKKIWSQFLIPLYQKYWPHTTFILHPFHFFQKRLTPILTITITFALKSPLHIFKIAVTSLTFPEPKRVWLILSVVNMLIP